MSDALPRAPCRHRMECGVLMVLVSDGFTHDFHRLTYWEIAAATRLLRRVMSPAYPIALMRNANASTPVMRNLAKKSREISRSPSIHALWDVHRFFGMDARLQPAFAAWRAEGERVPPAARAAHAWKSISYWKTSALLQSPFNRTIFMDNDVFVLEPTMMHNLLTQTLRVADVAIPVNTARLGFWARAPVPSLCIALIAYNRTAQVEAYLVGAADRLARHSNDVAGVEQRDQEMLWFEWYVSRPWLRMLVLPEEYYCPDVEPDRNGTRWQLNWGTLSNARAGSLPCKAVHGHARYYYRQRPPTLVNNRGLVTDLTADHEAADAKVLHYRDLHKQWPAFSSSTRGLPQARAL